jgi:hypothetical protein
MEGQGLSMWGRVNTMRIELGRREMSFGVNEVFFFYVKSIKVEIPLTDNPE